MRRTLLPALTCTLALLAAACSKPSSKSSAEGDPKAAKDADAPDDESGAKPADTKAATEPVARKDGAQAGPDAKAPTPAEGAKAEAGAAAGAKIGAKALAAGTFELLSEGAEPRELLRFSPKTGQVDRMAMTMTMHIKMELPGIPKQDQKTPPIEMVSRAETLSVEEGRITEEVSFDSYEVGEGGNPQMAAAMKTAMAQLEGFEQTLVYNERGDLVEGDMSMPTNANPQLAQSLENIGNTLEQVMVELPEEAVGAGAQWRKVSEFDNNGAKIQQTSTFNLESREGDQITLTTEIEQSALTKDFAPPGMPPGVNVELRDFESSGGGEVVYDLSSMLPISGKTSMTTKFAVEASGGGQEQVITTELVIDLELSKVEDEE